MKWFEYEIKGARVFAPVGNIEDLRIVFTDEHAANVVLTIRALEGRLVFMKRYSEYIYAVNMYTNISNRIRHGFDDKLSLEDWEVSVKNANSPKN